MKYLKLFEAFDLNEFEDILLPFIDDGVCSLEESSSKDFYVYSFESVKYVNTAKDKLEKKDINNWFCNGYLTHYIFCYSDKISDRLNEIFDNLKIVKGFERTSYFDKSDNCLFTVFDKAGPSIFFDSFKYWSPLEDEFNLSYAEVKLLTANFLEKKLNIKTHYIYKN